MAPLRGLRGRLQTMSRNTVLCDDRVMIQPIQVFWFLGSLMSYLGAFYFSTKMPEFNAIYRRAGGNTNIPHLVSRYFLVGLCFWLSWLCIRVVVHYLYTRLENKEEKTFLDRFYMVALEIPGNILFPVLAALLAECVKEKAGAIVCGFLLLCSFFLDLIFVDYKDMGMTEMLQVAQLAVLYAIGHQNILLMFLISTLIFLRLVLLFFLKEFLNWYRRQNVTPVRDEAELNTNARLNQDDLEAGRVESECTVESG
ncbi:uncharacterized protein [Henckelia pumila]|uniref:uncharacterized protein isoform X1 n=1 Tax=Henckelia pumila TaxID=405737 RepID=UPI003C6E4E53